MKKFDPTDWKSMAHHELLHLLVQQIITIAVYKNTLELIDDDNMDEKQFHQWLATVNKSYINSLMYTLKTQGSTAVSKKLTESLTKDWQTISYHEMYHLIQNGIILESEFEQWFLANRIKNETGN